MKMICNPVRYHKPHKVYSKSQMIVNTNNYPDEKIIISFTKLLELLPECKDGTHAEELIMAKFYSDIGDKIYVFESNMAYAIGDLVKEIKEGLRVVYEKGKEDGKNILIQLSNGEITLEDFYKTK